VEVGAEVDRCPLRYKPPHLIEIAVGCGIDQHVPVFRPLEHKIGDHLCLSHQRNVPIVWFLVSKEVLHDKKDLA